MFDYISINTIKEKLNTYGYVGGSPLHWTDSYGLYQAQGAGAGGRVIVIPPSSATAGDWGSFGNVVNICLAIASRSARGVAGIAMQSTSISRCQDLPSPSECKDDDPDKCKKIEEKIELAWKELRRLIRNEKKAQKSGNPPKKGGYQGHLQSFNGYKRNLEKLIYDAIEHGCYIDPRAYDFLERDYPSPL